jgi:hypothetical protein
MSQNSGRQRPPVADELITVSLALVAAGIVNNVVRITSNRRDETIFFWLTEGFDLAELRHARTLLEEYS